MKDVWSDDWPNCLHCRRVKINDEVGNVQKRCLNSNSGAFIHQTVTQFNFPARLHILAPPFLLSLPLLSPSPSLALSCIMFTPLHSSRSGVETSPYCFYWSIPIKNGRWVCPMWMTLGGWVPYGLQQVGVSYVDDTGWMGPIWVTTGGCVLCG